MTTFIYAAFAIAFLILVLGALRKSDASDVEEAVEVKPLVTPANSGRWLDLSDCIFNPADAQWLENELAFPKLARALTLERKRLAIRWLEALQASFDEFVRTPDIALGNMPDASSTHHWQMLWLTFRFKFLIAYALVMVRTFGPYHRLIPSFAWIPFSQPSGRAVRQAALASSRSSN